MSAEAPETLEERARDAEARRLAQCEFTRPLVLEAGAGTGKTATLVNRIVAWCLKAGWAKAQARRPEDDAGESAIAADVLSRVAAITFTEAAAAEMEQRVGEVLGQVARGESAVGLDESALPGDRALWSRRTHALLANLDHLVVRTIHAWCRRLLARRPLEAGLHPNFDVDADGEAQQAAIREEVEGALMQAFGAGDDGSLLELAALGFGPEKVVDALTLLVAEGVEPEDLAADPHGSERAARAAAELLAALRALDEAHGAELDTLPARNRASSDSLDALRKTASLLEGAELDAPGGFARLASALRELWPDKRLDRPKAWAKNDLNKGEGDAVEDSAALAARTRAVLAQLDTWLALDPATTEHTRHALRPLLEGVRASLRARGFATFADLLRGARDLLQRDEGVLAAERSGLDCLLVDEFQDTDPVQCEIVRRLALEGPTEARPSLFLVGDPKQSIYGWRNADLAAYDDFVTRVREAGGEVLRLSVNYRSVPAILAEVERVTKPVMQEEYGLQPAFQPLVPCEAKQDQPGFGGADRVPVEHWLTWNYDGSAQDIDPRPNAAPAAELEARAIARELVTLHGEAELQWKESALLLRVMSDAPIYLDALRKAGVPYVVERDRDYYRRREIIEAAAAVRCVLDPSDQLALLGFLRSGLVGVPDAALIPLWARGLPDRLGELDGPDPDRLAELRGIVEAVADGLPAETPGLARIPGWQHALTAAIESLAWLRESFERDAGDRFVEHLRRLLMAEVTEAARYLGAHRVAGLQQLFDDLADALAREGDVQVALRRLRIGVAETREAEQAQVPDSQRDAVRVMSIHKAKGLDFGHVYLAQMHKEAGSRGRREDRVERVGDGLEWRLFGVPTLGFGAVAARRERVVQAERVRELYVAMTRAKDRLVTLGVWDENPTPRPPEGCKKLVDLFASRRSLPRDLAGVMRERSEAGPPLHRDEDGARWRFPGLEFEESGAVAADETGPRLPDAAEVEAGATRLGELAAAAREREARLRSGSPSRAKQERQQPEDGEARALHRFGDAAVDDRAEGAVDSGSERSERDRAVAMASGTAIHGLLEDWDLAADPEAELARLRVGLAERLDDGLDAEERAAAVATCDEILDGFANGPLRGEFLALADRVVARELPVWSAPDGDGAAGVCFDSGVIDLVYRDDDGALVVADYKTDRVDAGDEAAVAALAERYRDQGEFYTDCLQRALGLESRPRFELWLLRAGRIVSP